MAAASPPLGQPRYVTRGVSKTLPTLRFTESQKPMRHHPLDAHDPAGLVIGNGNPVSLNTPGGQRNRLQRANIRCRNLTTPRPTIPNSPPLSAINCRIEFR